jgi:ATP-dependent DNA helicase RecG
LHQLRGRVGRGADQSYCILMTSYKLTKESKQRINTMVSTTNGFDIAEADLKLRGPGDLMGTQQSGILDLLIADLGKDTQILEIARQAAEKLLENDPNLDKEENALIKQQVLRQRKSSLNWSRIG